MHRNATSPSPTSATDAVARVFAYDQDLLTRDIDAVLTIHPRDAFLAVDRPVDDLWDTPCQFCLHDPPKRSDGMFVDPENGSVLAVCLDCSFGGINLVAKARGLK